MAAVLLPLEFVVFDAADRETVAALALIALETLIGAVVYIGTLGLLAPETLREAVQLAKSARRRKGGVTPEAETAGAGADPASPESPEPGPAGGDRAGS